MASISVLIPAFRPTFLRQAIASVLTQAIEDLEILISDDSGADEVVKVVEQFRDPRIRYLRTAGRIGAAENCLSLWEQAQHDLIQFVLDDDLLLPHGLAELTAQHERRPDASMYFGTRFVVDGATRITRDPATRPKDVIELNARSMSANLVGKVQNPIGEFTNVLMNRATGLTPDLFASYYGFEVRMLGDVSFYLGASRCGPAIGIRHPVGAFRLHGDQRSSPVHNPIFAIGICEWEMFIRGETAEGRLTPEQALAALDKLKTAYESWGGQFQPILDMRPGLDVLADQVRAGERDLLGGDFPGRWEDFISRVLGPGASA